MKSVLSISKTAATLIPLWLLLAPAARAQSGLDGFDPGADRNVKALAVQPDGKIIVGGTFSNLGGGGTGTTTRKRIGRLYPDGTLDIGFNPGANDVVDALAVQTDGKIVVGGFFTTLGGGATTVRNRIGRVNADGSLDASFNPGANAEITCLALQTDGKILVGGSFTTFGGGATGTVVRNRIARLNASGTLDTTFNPGANDRISAIALQADGKILVGGNFTTLGGGGTGTIARSCIGRLNSDGTIDDSFNPGATGRGTHPEDSTVFAIVVQADGKIVFGGELTAAGGGIGAAFARSQIARANPDGAIDTSFDPGATNDVKGLALQPDGKILVVGDFVKLGGGNSGVTTRNLIGRLNADGSLDMGFNPGASGGPAMICVALQADGKILFGGQFTAIGGGTGTTPRNFIARVNADGTVDDGSPTPTPTPVPPAIATQPADKTVTAGVTANFRVTATGTTPLRYQWSKNGVNISGATKAFYTTPPTTTTDSGSYFSVVVSNSVGSVRSNNATLTVTEAIPPSITTQPANKRVTAGATPKFTVTATGSAPLSYQWRKNGVDISGATKASYTTPPTTAADNGALFSVVVSNSVGGVTSNDAVLTVH